MKKPILDLYHRLKSEGRLSKRTGLCYEVAKAGIAEYEEFEKDMGPTVKDAGQLLLENKSTSYWGSGDGSPKLGELTPLRETILLLFAAYRNEL